MKLPLRLQAAVCGLVALVNTTLVAAIPALERVAPVPADQPVPIEDFFRPPLFSRTQLNPGGTHIGALITTPSDQMELLIYDIASQKLGRISGGTNSRDIYSFGWLDDRHVFFHLSARKIYGAGLFAAHVDRLGASWPLLQYCATRLIAVPRENRLFPLVWIRNDVADGRDAGPVTLTAGGNYGNFINLTRADASYRELQDARDMNQRRIAASHPKVPGLGAGYMADKDGRLAFGFTGDDGVIRMHRLVGEKWVLSPIDLEKIDVLGAGDQPGEIVASIPMPDAPAQLCLVDAETGATKEVLLQDKNYDFRGWTFRNPDDGRILGLMFDRAVPASVWFDPGYRAVQKMAEAQFPGQVVRLIGSAQKGKIFLVETWSDRQPSVYHILDLEKRQMGLVKNSRPWIDPQRMRPMSLIRYKTAEGRELDAYLTLPAGASKTNPVPMIVLPHGGPWVRDTWGFDGEVQFLASRGYAVLQPNYRGSPGYDWMFPIEDQWAFMKMHADVTAATRKALGTGMVDPDRVAIMGGSFGAYLALCGVVHEPELYRCAVTIAGVFDWANVVKEEKYYQFDSPQYARMLRKLGDPTKEKEKFDEISPIRRVDQVRVPMFVSHGKEDGVASVSESKRLISALQKNKVPVETLLVSEEGHGMVRFNNRLELYRRIEAFLAKNLPFTPKEL